MLYILPGRHKFADEMSDHFFFNSYWFKRISAEDQYLLSHHFRQYDQIPAMGLYICITSPNLFEQRFLGISEAPFQASALSCRKQLHKLLQAQCLQLFNGFSSVLEYFLGHFYRFLLPVLRGAILPTFLPGGALRDACVGLPLIAELEPPNG